MANFGDEFKGAISIYFTLFLSKTKASKRLLFDVTLANKDEK